MSNIDRLPSIRLAASSRKVKVMRTEADRLCDLADQRPSEEAWLLYAEAGRLRDRAYLTDEQDFYRKFDRPEE
jgi:hypothetical protein